MSPFVRRSSVVAIDVGIASEVPEIRSHFRVEGAIPTDNRGHQTVDIGQRVL
jgi:hypothetical protein